MKDKAINVVGWSFKRAMPGDTFPQKANYTFTWYCPDKRKDKDNIMSAQKFVFDALQQIGYIKNDGWKQIGDISHRFMVDKNNPRLEVELEEIA
jgi:Holliday junction resolvase RusA-like endonuclease